MKKTLLFALGCAFAAAALGQTYKWTDRNGRVQYGDAPPPGVKATALRPPPAAPAPAAKPADQDGAKKGPLTPAERDAEYRKRQEEAAKKVAKDEQADQTKKQNCARAQDYLRNMTSGQRLSGIDAKGERYYLDEQQVAQETVKAQRAVQDWCK